MHYQDLLQNNMNYCNFFNMVLSFHRKIQWKSWPDGRTGVGWMKYAGRQALVSDCVVVLQSANKSNAAVSN
jgi:hypothetical protein